MIDISEADEYFDRIIICLDGDARLKNKKLQPKVKDYLDKDFDSKSIGENDRRHKPNLIFAPGYFAPESYLYKIIYSLINNQIQYADFWRGVEQNEEITLYTPDKIKNMFGNIETEFSNTDLKKIFGENLDNSDLWKFIRKSGLIEYYYKDYMTISTLVKFAEDLQNAYNMTSRLFIENKRV